MNSSLRSNDNGSGFDTRKRNQRRDSFAAPWLERSSVSDCRNFFAALSSFKYVSQNASEAELVYPRIAAACEERAEFAVSAVMKDMWLALLMTTSYLSPGRLRSNGILCHAAFASGPRLSSEPVMPIKGREMLLNECAVNPNCRGPWGDRQRMAFARGSEKF